MKKNYILAAAALLLAAFSLQAQNFQEGFFLKNYRLGYRYNPALMSEGDFLSIGQIGIDSGNNVGASAFLYPLSDGSIVTGLNRNVSAETFLGNIPINCDITSSLSYNLLSYGIRRGANMHTFEVNLRGGYGISVPKEIFELAKLGNTAETYHLGSLRAGGELYAELAYGFSRKIGETLSIGARAKLLAGLYAADYHFGRLDLTMTENEYKVELEGYLDLTNRMKKIGTNDEGYMDFTRLMSKGKLGWPTGAGLAVDLGVVWTPVEHLTMAFSALDLGYMLWYYGNAGRASGEMSFDGFENVTIDQFNSTDLVKLTNGIKEEFIAQLNHTPLDKTFRFKELPLRGNAAIKYEMPFYEALTIGLTGSYWQNSWSKYWDARFGLALNPVEWLDITGNFGHGAFGHVWGAAATVHVLGFRLNAGLENGFGGTIPYTSTPLKARSKVLTFGITYDLN